MVSRRVRAFLDARCLVGLLVAGLAMGCRSGSGAGENEAPTGPCAAGYTECGGQCVNLQGDGTHCGSCGTACPLDQVCATGACSAAGCPAGQLQCGTSCVISASDPRNCGSCGVACPSPTTCSNGSCGCPAGSSNCGGSGGAPVAGSGGLGAGESGGGGTGGNVINPACPGDASEAYQGAPAGVPGTVEAEDFDPGGYSDTSTGNEGGAHRTDVDVDIKALGTGHAVGWMTAGEWLEYTVNVPLAGDYTLSVRSGAVDAGRTLEFSQCGTALTAPVAVPQIAAWGEVATATAGTVHLEAGLQVIRVTVGPSDFVDLDSFTLDPGGTGTGGTGGTGGSGGSSPALVNNYDGARTGTVSLDADWKFHLGDVSGAEATTYDDASWEALDVPHDFSISLPFNQSSAAGPGGGYLDGGVGWYRKSFALPASSSGQRVFVQFDGVYMDSTVWLNGTRVCARPYGYSSFECDLTTSANFGGSNVLAVRVNNQLPSSRWYSGSGIYRHVWLKTVNPVRVAYTGAYVTTPQVSAASATVNVNVSVRNDAATSQSVTVASSIRDPGGTEVAAATAAPQAIAAGATAAVEQTATVSNPRLWSTTAPTMYSVITTVSVNGAIVDTYTTPFGIRSFAFDANTGFSLNGQRMKLNGVCLHHDLGALGAAVNYRAMEKRFELLKEMGANAVRTSHNPPAPEFLDLADRFGFLVMDEAFDMWYGAKTEYDYARFFREWADTDIMDMVSRDRNHPSIIIWSIGNEVPQAGDQNVAQQLIDAVRSKDDTRVIGQAFAAWSYDEGTAGLEDIVGLNYLPNLYDSQHAAHPTWKFLGSETSSGFRSRGVYNNSNNQSSSYEDAWAGWGQSAEASWRDVNTRDWIAGEFIWTGFDYIGEPTPYEWPSKSSYFGAIDTANFPKDVFYFYQSRWNYDGPTMVHIVPMDWTSWTVGRSVRVLVYSNADSVELFLNGSSLGSKTMNRSDGHLEWSVPFATGALEARATKGGMVVVTDAVRTAGPAAALALKVDRSSIAADGRDLAFVQVDVVDAEGVVVPQASNSVDFAIEGPGVIAGVDNGNAISHESYKGTSRSAFSGKVLAIVQSRTTPGQITLNATSRGLAGGSVVIASSTP